MGDQPYQRRLAAILAADVVGYGRHIEEDEDGTVAAWTAARTTVIDPGISRHSGRIIKHTGDGFLAEFGAIFEAVQCAMALQESLAANPLDFRMGVHLGDVIEELGDVHGEGVNVAARLESIAEPGGICISGDVHNQIRNRIDRAFEDLGEVEVKHISAPIRVWKWRPGASKPVSTTAVSAPSAQTRPAIAVLPFDNLSGDPEQEYFSDGITEDIITALSRIRQFFVIARNTSFTYKGRAVDVQTIANDLNVRYVLEGSVRKADNRVRITAQLIDGESGNHVWAEKYDRELEDIFAVQDDITGTVVTAIEPELGRAEQERARRKPPDDLDAWDCYQRGLWHFSRTSRDDNTEAQASFRRAIEIDPNFARGYAGLAAALTQSMILGFAAAPQEALREGAVAARTALKLDEMESGAYFALAMANVFARDLAAGLAAAKKGIDISPNSPFGHIVMGMSYAFSGNPEEALPHFDDAERVSPKDPIIFLAYQGRSTAYLVLGEFENAERWAREAAQFPTATFWPIMLRAIALVNLGRTAEATDLIRNIARDTPYFGLDFIRRTLPTNEPRIMELFVEGLTKAGLPES